MKGSKTPPGNPGGEVKSVSSPPGFLGRVVKKVSGAPGFGEREDEIVELAMEEKVKRFGGRIRPKLPEERDPHRSSETTGG